MNIYSAEVRCYVYALRRYFMCVLNVIYRWFGPFSCIFAGLNGRRWILSWWIADALRIRNAHPKIYIARKYTLKMTPNSSEDKRSI